MPNEELERPSEDGQTTTTPLWQRRGLKSEADLEKAFDDYKADIKRHKDRERELEERAKKADEYEAKVRAEEEARMTDYDKLQKRHATLESENTGLREQLARTQREFSYERLVSTRLSGKTPEEVKIIRRLYDAEAVKGYESDEELESRLTGVDTEYAEWQALRATKSGPDLSAQPSTSNVSVQVMDAQQNPFDANYLASLDGKTKAGQRRRK